MDRLELLSVDLLDQHRSTVNALLDCQRRVGSPLGWHYLLDLSWSTHMLEPSPGQRILDAGAGIGLMQWWLAQHGVNVISVDRLNRTYVPKAIRSQFRVRGWRHQQLGMVVPMIRDFLPSRSIRQWPQYPSKVTSAVRDLLRRPEAERQYGTVFIYNQDLARLAHIRDESVDAVVSISALEHNSPENLKRCVAELLRVLKPGGKLVATVAAARDHDWFHEPSHGWCYTDATLRRIFALSPDCPSNFDRYDEYFERLRGCTQLQEHLDPAYFRSGNNGMPWGIWKPEYYPVGIVKHKAVAVRTRPA